MMRERKHHSGKGLARFVGTAGALAVCATVQGAMPLAPYRPGPRDGLNPDPVHVQPFADGWIVRPTGVQDHTNLEWALRHTLPGGTVKLRNGTYKIGRPIVVPNFDGTLRGVGPGSTIITCTDALSIELWEQPGGGASMGEELPEGFPRVSVDGASTKSPPACFVFYKTPLLPGESPESRANSIAIEKLTYRGATRADPWALGDETVFAAIFNSFDWNAPDVDQITTRQDVRASQLLVDGYSSPVFGPFENACSCLTIVGGIVLTTNYDLNVSDEDDGFGAANGGVLRVNPADGDVLLDSCTFRHCRFGPNIVGIANGNITVKRVVTDGCRANCVGVYDASGASVLFEGNDLSCDAFLLPPELAAGQTDVPSSIGCTVVVQGLSASIGMVFNARFLSLATDPLAHMAHPEAGPFGTWRPQGSALAPAPSEFLVQDSTCVSSDTPNTYCIHLVDLVRPVYGAQTLILEAVRDNACVNSQTCISLEHVTVGDVSGNDCASRAFGIELYDSSAGIEDNSFSFPLGVAPCEIRNLVLGEKIDLSRVVPGAGVCSSQ